jgi:8-oxo-dGTP diphosphatase
MSTKKAAYTYEYPHPSVTVDMVIFTVRERRLELLLIERGGEPFKGSWALPGGFVRMDEDLSDAAVRELQEETGITVRYLRQVGAFGRPGRDPRERVISVAFGAIIPSTGLTLAAGTDAANVRWWPFDPLPPLAFDHGEIVKAAHDHIVDQLSRSLIAFQFLPAEFTLTELQQVHEAIQGGELDKRNFRKWIASLDTVEPTGRKRGGEQHRPAELYRLSKAAARLSRTESGRT